MPEDGPHAEVGSKQKLSPWGAMIQEEEQKSLLAAAKAADKIPMISLVSTAFVEYLNGQ